MLSQNGEKIPSLKFNFRFFLRISLSVYAQSFGHNNFPKKFGKFDACRINLLIFGVYFYLWEFRFPRIHSDSVKVNFDVPL